MYMNDNGELMFKLWVSKRFDDCFDINKAK